MLKREQPESIEAYSAALRERLTGVLPPDKIEEVVAETECHLEERAEELRRRADVYEKQAIAEFIPARKLAGGINRAWAATYLRHGGTKWLQNVSAVFCVLALTLLLAQFLIVSKLPLPLQNPRYVINVLFAAPLVVFVLALIACRPQLRRFTYGGLGGVALFTVLGGWLCASGEQGNISRFDAPAHYKDTLALHKYQQEEARLLRKILPFYRSPIIVPERIIGRKVGADLIVRLREFNEGETEANTERNQGSNALRRELSTVLLLPEFLRVGERYLVPQVVTDQQGISVFRKLSPEAQWNVSVENVGIYNTRRALVAAWQKAEPESLASLGKAQRLWRHEAPLHLKMLEGYAVTRQKTLQRDMALMASPKWRFDTASARFIGTFGLYAAGILLAADTLGGALGMLLLRNLRRRKLRQGKTA